jgi:multidrug resistance efflux pump
MKKYLFYITLIVLVISLTITSFLFKDGTQAMVAIVDSQVTAVSYQKPVIVKKLSVVSGQEVEIGEFLLEVVRPDLDLDMEKRLTEKANLSSEIEANSRQKLLELRILNLDTEEKVGKINAQVEELDYELKQIQNVGKSVRKLYSGQIRSTMEDSLLVQRKAQLSREKANLSESKSKQIALLVARYEDKELVIVARLRFLDQEITSLQAELEGLKRFARFKGTVGSVNVQLDELVPPFKSLLSIYESKPTLIKAFMNERIKYSAKEGDKVWVSSDKRRYKVSGTIIEVGSRITEYPTKIEPFQTIKSYGQEVFVKISPENRFLNGEKVYVYPIDVE